MKENIKEDIKTVEYNMKCIRNVMNNFEDELCENMQTKTDEVSKIIDNILSDYKRVLKENEQLRTEANSLKKDISNMYDEEVIISIISDNFNLSRNEVLKLLGGEE